MNNPRLASVQPELDVGPQNGPRSSLETEFPSLELQPVAQMESWRKEVYRPIYHVHKWWANRLGSIFRAIVLGGSLGPDEKVWDHFYADGHDFSDQIVLDPFMGSGTTVGEALKLGSRVVGCDINPVAYFAARTALELCDRERLEAAFDRLRNRVVHEFSDLYRSTFDGEEAEILYTFWVMVAECPECGNGTDLFKKRIFSANAYPKKKPQSWASCPCCGEINQVLYTDDGAKCRSCATHFDPQEGAAKGRDFRCGSCGTISRIKDSVTREGRPHYRPYALMLLLADGSKVYKKPSERDLETYRDAQVRLAESSLPIPNAVIPPGVNTDQARGYGFMAWRQLFNDRQLFTLGHILKGIMAEPERDVRDGLLALFSGVLEFNNMFCSFKGEGTGAVRHMFHHHILKPERMPLEANPWGTNKSSGSMLTLFKRRLLTASEYSKDPFEVAAHERQGKVSGTKVFGINKPIRPRLATDFNEIVSGEAEALLLSQDSANLPIPSQSVDLVITDPPYFDNVNYSELADFFYCWLSEALGSEHAAFTRATTRAVGEVQNQDAEAFSDLLAAVFSESNRVLKEDGILAFTFHHARSEAWVAVAHALERAGLYVLATHPVKGEMSVAAPKSKAKEPIDLDLIIVTGKARARRNQKRSIDALVAEAHSKVRLFSKNGVRLSRGDVRVVMMGEYLKAHCDFTGQEQTCKHDATELMERLTDAIEEVFAAQEPG